MDSENQDDGSFDDGADIATSPFLMASFTVLNTLEWTPHDIPSGLGFKQLGLVWDLLQPLAMVFNPYVGWNTVVLEKPIYLGLFLAFLWDPNVVGVNNTGSIVIFWLTVATIFIMSILLASRTGFENEKVMCVVRLVARSITSPLYWPMLNILLSRMVCVETHAMDEDGDLQTRRHLWLFDDEDCDGGLHIAEVIAGSIAIALHCVMGLVAVATLFDISSFSDDPLARANTSIDVLMWVYKTGASLCFFLLLARGMVVELGVIVMLSSLAVLAFTVITCPYYLQPTNSVMAATFASVAWFAFMSCFTSPEESDIPRDVLIVAWSIFPVVYVGAYFLLANMRVSRACLARFDELLSGTAEHQAHGVFPKYLPDNDQIVSKHSDLEGWLLELESSLPTTYYRDNNANQEEDEPLDLMLPYIENIHLASDVELSTRFLTLWDRGIGSRPSLRMLAMASRIFTKGLCKYPHAREVQVQFALFLIRYLERSHVTIRFITGLESSHAVDRFQVISAYTIFKMANTLRTNLGIRDRTHCQALENARSHHHEALVLMHQFWLKVQESGDGLRGLAGLANQITDRREKAKLGFRWMLRQHPQDTQILMQLASFLQQVMLDDVAYEHCLEEVDNIQLKRASSPAHTTRNNGTASTKTGVQEGSNAISLLDQKTIKSNQGHVGSTVRVLQLTIRIAFIPLVLLLVAEFVVAYLYTTSHYDMIHQIYATGQARFLCQRAGVTLQQIIDHIQQDEASQQTDSSLSASYVQVKDKLQAITTALEVHHNAVTVGSRGVTSAQHKHFLKSPNAVLEYYEISGGKPVPEIVSPWHLGNLMVTVLTEILRVQDISLIPQHKYTSIVLENLPLAVSHVFNESAALVETHSRAMASNTKTAAVLLFITSVVMVFVVYLLFVWNFNKIATGKITTLELFTLIPEATLQSTAEDAKMKLKSFEEDSEVGQERAFSSIITTSGGDKLDTLQAPTSGANRPSTSSPPQTNSPTLMIPTAVPDLLPPKTGQAQFPGSDTEQLASRPDMMYRASMTDQEAMDSLSVRKDSAVAIILKRGLGDSLPTSERSSMHRSGYGTGPAVGGASNGIAPVPTADGPDRHDERADRDEKMSQASEELNSKHEDKKRGGQADTETSATRSSQNKEQLYLSAVGLFTVLLAIGVAATAETFALVPGELAEAYAADDQALQDTLLLRQLMADLTSHARLFAQSGDPMFYDMYWDKMNDMELKNLKQRFWSLGLDERELLTLELAYRQIEVLHERHLISFVLVTQFYHLGDPAVSGGGLDELSQVTWSKEVLTRDLLDEFVTVFPSTYTYTNYLEDSRLPNENAQRLVNNVASHVGGLYEIGVLAALRHPVYERDDLTDAMMLAKIDAWIAEAEGLVRAGQVTSSLLAGVTSAVLTPLRRNAAGDATATNVRITAGMATSITTYANQLVRYDDLVLYVAGTVFPSKDSDVVAMSKVQVNQYRVVQEGLYACIASVSAIGRLYIWTALAGIDLVNGAPGAGLAASNAFWDGILTAMPDNARAALEAIDAYEKIGTVPREVATLADQDRAYSQAAAMSGDVDGFRAMLSAMYNASAVQLDLPEMQAILGLKKQIARGTLFDDMYLQQYDAGMQASLRFAEDVHVRFQDRTSHEVTKFHFHIRVSLSTSVVIAILTYIFSMCMVFIFTTPYRRARAYRLRREHYLANNPQGGASGTGQGTDGQPQRTMMQEVEPLEETDWGRDLYKTVAFLVIAGLATVSCAMLIELRDRVNRMDTAYTEIEHMRMDIGRFEDGIRNVTDSVLWFTQFGEERALLRYQALIEDGGIFHEVEEDLVQTTTFEREDEAAFELQTGRLQHLRERFEICEWFHRVAIRMMFPENATALLLPVIAAQEWNLTGEQDYILNRIKYRRDYASDLMYTTSAEDYGRSDKARFLLSSQRYLSARKEVLIVAHKMVDTSIKEWTVAQEEAKAQVVDGLLGTKIVLCVMVGINVLFILKVVQEMLVFGAGSNEQNQRGLREHFYKMTRQCRWALLVVEIMLVIFFVLLYVRETRTESDVATLNKASSLQWLVAQSLVQANRIPEDPAINIVGIQTELAALAVYMRDHRASLYDTSSASGASIDTGLMYETTYTERGTVDTCAEGTNEYAPAPLSVDARYLAFVVGIETISRLGLVDGHGIGRENLDTTAARQLIVDHVAQLNEKVDPLLEGLQLSVEAYHEAMLSNAQEFLVWCIFAAVATLVVIFVEYQFVFLPMIAQLIEEEDGTKLMLNMIPLDVRESVPEIAQYFSTGKVDEDEKMKKLLQQSEKLLQNILPPIISRRLKAGEKLIADDHAKVTVSFCALVGFDEVSKDMSAKQIVSFLNDLYSKFDALTDKLDLEKIKTIGDVYFMCGGLTEVTQEDHPLRVVETVLYFFETLNQRNNKQNTPQISMKAGINTGPAVAGVIGSKKVAYDLWGDAVNVSSRLCGTGLPGKIAVYNTTMEEVNEYYTFTERPVEAKGKGLIKTYILEGRIKNSPYTYLFNSTAHPDGRAASGSLSEGLPRTMSSAGT